MWLLVAVCVLISGAACDDLVSVVVVYRHGDRTPIEPYPTDPYRNASFWPVGFGQLTNLGKMQHYLLGEWLRSRYAPFLPSRYSEKDVYVRSTDSDRTLMSASANLAGLYPPKDDQIWDAAIPWQPIPIHTVPELEDNILSMKKACPTYERLVEKLYNSDLFVNITRRNHDLYAYLTKNSGGLVNTLERVEYLYNTLTIEKLYNYTLPDWTRTVYPDRMKPWAELSFVVPAYTPQMARFKTGTIFNEIIEFFLNSTKGGDHRKLMVFSAHDITIGNLLNSMGAFQPHCPPYTSTILFELRKAADFYVRMYYKNSSIVQNVTLKGCDFDCDFDDFVDILKPLVLTRAQWDLECQPAWYPHYEWDTLQYFVYLSAVMSFLIFTVSILLVCKWFRLWRKTRDAMYTQLPNDEVA